MVMDNSLQLLAGSRLADTQAAVVQTGVQEISLAVARATDLTARPWRVTFGRVDRLDGSALNTGTGGNAETGGQVAVTAFQSAGYAYTAGFIAEPAIPPRRSNPVLNPGDPVISSQQSPLFVELAWGLAQAKPFRLLANWPMLGGSLVVVGSYVEVWAGMNVQNPGSPPIDPGSYPKFTAAIAPQDGPWVEAGELSLQQVVPVLPLSPVGSTAPVQLLKDGVANPTNGGFVLFLVGGARAAVPGSAVANTAPFLGWSGSLRERFPNAPIGTGRHVSIDYNVPSGPEGVTVQDNAVPDGSGGFNANPGSVGINIRARGALTFTDLDFAVNAGSGLITATPSANPGFIVATGGWTQAAGYAPTVAHNLGNATIVAPTQGAAIFVPDFARSVTVHLGVQDTTFNGGEVRVPVTGDVACQLVWYDDTGTVVDIAFQFTSIVAGQPAAPVVWHPVPARATMLGVYGPPTIEQVGLVHWRIAP